MPDLRRDPVTGDLVLFAPDRVARPYTVAAALDDTAVSACPFCPGRESETPPEVLRTGNGAPNTPRWRVRVFPNRFPVVGGPSAGEGAGGAHEVAVLTPEHNRSFGRLADDEAVEVLTVLRDRARHHLGAGRAFVQALVNHGRAAGASIAHLHAQVVALEFVPPAVSALAARFDAHTRDPLSLDRECDPALLVDNGRALTWCPWASWAPYMMRVAHAEPAVSFDRADDPAIAAVAIATRDALARLRHVLDDAAFNLAIRTAPPSGNTRQYWFVEIVPRTIIVGGFEQGTGVLVNTVTPEAAADALRAAQP
ncbi:MAG: galactose-1-phosphate uridylyltransferase [Acidimicrobiia bacterium]